MLSTLEDYFIIENSDITFEKMLNSSYLSKERADELKKSKVLLIPLEDFRENIHLCFYQGARELSIYLNENNPELSFDLCIEKTDYQELTLHGEEFRLGVFLLQNIIAPVFVGVIVKYINTMLFAKKEDTISIDLIITKQDPTDESLRIKYRGNPIDFEEKVNKQLGIYSKSGKFVEGNSSGTKINELF